MGVDVCGWGAMPLMSLVYKSGHMIFKKNKKNKNPGGAIRGLPSQAAMLCCS